VQQAIELQAARNSLIYLLLLGTGLRVNEARSLKWSDLDLKAGTLTTRPYWSGNKNGKEETLPLPPDLVCTLELWKVRHTCKGDLVVVIPKNFLKTFYDDLDAADIEREDSAKRVLDLHALRHTYGSRLVAAGVDIKTVQTLMRHSTPTLTLGIYVHSDKKRMRDAVASLPRVTPSKSHIAIA